MGTYAVVDITTNLVINTIIWDGVDYLPFDEGFTVVETDKASIGWSYISGEFIAPPTPPLTDAEIIALNTGELHQFTQLATIQKTALVDRIGTLNDAIELDMATPEEIAELPVRQSQLLKWKKYAIFLGRVTLQPGWALTVVWPDQPIDGTNLGTSTAAPEVV